MNIVDDKYTYFTEFNVSDIKRIDIKRAFYIKTKQFNIKDSDTNLSSVISMNRYNINLYCIYPELLKKVYVNGKPFIIEMLDKKYRFEIGNRIVNNKKYLDIIYKNHELLTISVKLKKKSKKHTWSFSNDPETGYTKWVT